MPPRHRGTGEPEPVLSARRVGATQLSQLPLKLLGGRGADGWRGGDGAQHILLLLRCTADKRRCENAAQRGGSVTGGRAHCRTRSACLRSRRTPTHRTAKLLSGYEGSEGVGGVGGARALLARRRKTAGRCSPASPPRGSGAAPRSAGCRADPAPVGGAGAAAAGRGRAAAAAARRLPAHAG